MDPGVVYSPVGLDGTGRFRLDPGPVLPRRPMARAHWHDVLEINFVRGGRGLYRIGDRTYAIEPGALFVIPAGVPHRTAPDGRDPHWHLTLYFRPEALGPLGPRAVAHASAVAASAQRIPAAPFRDLWECLFDGLGREARHAADGWGLGACAKLLDACLLVERCARAAAAPEVVVPSHQGAYLHRMMACIEGHLEEPLTLERIASAAGLHPNYASALFRQRTGTPLFAYIRSRRLGRARALLETSTLTVAEVARRCGFRSAPSFHRALRAAFGATPAGLRRLAARPPSADADPAEAGGPAGDERRRGAP